MILFVLIILFFSLVLNIWFGGIVIFFFGGLIGVMDVLMNVNVVEMEKLMCCLIMLFCYVFWSFGIFVGMMSGGFLIEMFGIVGYLIVLMVVGFVLLVVVWFYLFYDVLYVSEVCEKVKLFLSLLFWLFGIMVLFFMILEGLVFDWGVFYICCEFGVLFVFFGFVFGVFVFMMMIMCFVGDLVCDCFGVVKMFCFCIVMVIIGFVMVGFVLNMVVVFIGFVICGIGIFNMVLIVFLVVGNLLGFV